MGGDRVQGLVLGLAGPPGQTLTVTRQRLTVVDHRDGPGGAGGAGADGGDGADRGDGVLAACRALVLDHATATEVEADALRAPEVGGSVHLDDLTVDLHPLDDRHVDLRFSDGGRSAQSPVGHVADAVLTLLTARRLDAEPARPRLHGGALVDDAGRAVLVLGVPGAGKSTLVAHLASRGLGLLSDEQVTVLDDLDRVGGSTRPVAVKPGGLAHLPAGTRRPGPGGDRHGSLPVLVPAADLGTRHRLLGRPVLVVLPHRTPTGPADEPTTLDGGGDDPVASWDRLDPVEAFEALCDNNLDLEDRPLAALAAFARLAATVPVVRLHYAEAASAAPVVRALLADPPTVRGVPWSVHDHDHDHDRRPASAAVAAGAPTAAPSGDAISVAIGDEVVLYHRTSRVRARLNPAGAAWWATAPAPLPSPTDPARTLADALLDHGFLVPDT